MKHKGERRAGEAARLSCGGFTLVELIITMFVSVLAFAIATNIFTALLTQFKQQSKIAETNIEGAVGLEILRRDLESAGYGLPTSFMPGVTFTSESPGPPGLLLGLAVWLNDNLKPDKIPRPITSVNNSPFTMQASDYLAIRSLLVARNSSCGKSATVRLGVPLREDLGPESFQSSDTDSVIVINPKISDGVSVLELVGSGATISATYSDAKSTAPWIPPGPSDTRLIYGVDPTATLRFPFNRADYYLDAGGTPSYCAKGTGTLFKRVLLHGSTAFDTPLPLLDCVADMEVVYGMDISDPPDGVIDTNYNNITALTAEEVRTRVREVQVHILAHEGQRDPNYTHPISNIKVGDRLFTLATRVPDYKNYKWKVYKIFVKPPNFGG